MRLLHSKTQWKKKPQKTLFIPLEINLMTFKPAYENNSGGTGLLSDNTLLSFQLWQKKKKEKEQKKEKKKKGQIAGGRRPNCLWTLVSLCGRVSLSHIYHHDDNDEGQTIKYWGGGAALYTQKKFLFQHWIKI